jgi:hypothetical protein
MPGPPPLSLANPRADRDDPTLEASVRPARLGAGAALRYVVLGLAVLFATLLVAMAPRHSIMSVGFAVGATFACAGFTLLERRAPRVGVGPVVAAIAIVFAVSVAVPPRTSNDLWSYTMYGRTVSVHSASPYDRVPADYPTDPFFGRVSPIWQHRGSVFGPLWVGYATVGTVLAGDSAFGNRLFFQITAALAAAAALLLIWRTTRSPVALAWLGLHPMFGAVAVNGGHNDLVIGLALVAGVLLLARRRPLAAGIVIGLAALVKLTALLALIGVVVWAWRRRERRTATFTVAAAAATVALGYGPLFGSAWHVLSGANRTVTPASIWNSLVDLMLGHNAFRDVANPLAPNTTLIVISYVSLGCVVLLAFALAWRAARSERVAPTVGVATATYPFVAEYAYPWYACWALPMFAEPDPSPLAWVVWTQAALMLAVLKLPVHWNGTALDDSVRVLLTYAAPAVLLVLFVTARPWPRGREPRSVTPVGATVPAPAG